MSDAIKLALGIALAGFLVWAGWMFRGYQEDRVQLQISRVVDAVNVIKAQGVAAIQIEQKTIYAKTVEKIKTETVYKECVADDAMMTLTNKALGF